MRRKPSRPHILAAVVTCTSASTTAAVANQAFAAIVEEKSVVTRSVYVSLTSARGTAGAYDLSPARATANGGG